MFPKHHMKPRNTETRGHLLRFTHTVLESSCWLLRRWRGTGQPQQAKAGTQQGEVLRCKQIKEIVWTVGRKHRKLLKPTWAQNRKSRKFTKPVSWVGKMSEQFERLVWALSVQLMLLGG